MTAIFPSPKFPHSTTDMRKSINLWRKILQNLTSNKNHFQSQDVSPGRKKKKYQDTSHVDFWPTFPQHQNLFAHESHGSFPNKTITLLVELLATVTHDARLSRITIIQLHSSSTSRVQPLFFELINQIINCIEIPWLTFSVD